MTTQQIPQFDVDRATEVLSTAKRLKMYPDPLPEDGAVRIQEAEKMVQLALQADRVAREVGKDKVPNADAIGEVLFVAQVVGGTESVDVVIEGAKTRWPWADVVKHVLDNGNSNLTLPNEADQKRLDAERVRREGGERAEPELKEEREDTARAAAEVGEGERASDPMPGSDASPSPETLGEERWRDADGQVWVVDQHLKSGVEAHLLDTTEKTILPPDFLVARVDTPKEEPSPQSSSQPSATAPSPSSTPPAEPPPTTPETGSSEPSTTPSAPSPPPQPSPPPSTSLDPEHEALIERVRADYERARLPLPVDVTQPPTMPEDLTNVPDIQARKLHSQFNACSARARYLMGLERQAKIGCERLKKQAMRPAMKNAREQLGSAATMTEVKQSAEEHPAVVKWSEYEDLHADREAAMRDLFNIYTENVSVLSRDWTERTTEERGA